jgi:hypothetical protein
MEARMSQQRSNDKSNSSKAALQNVQRAENRSESLLPGDDASDAGDGRFEVAEEVNLDQQSDKLRRVGKGPEALDADALPDAPDDDSGNGAQPR